MRRLNCNPAGQSLLTPRKPQGHWGFRNWGIEVLVTQPLKRSPRANAKDEKEETSKRLPTQLSSTSRKSSTSATLPPLVDRHEHDEDCPCGGCVAWGEAKLAHQSDLAIFRQELIIHGVNTQMWGQDGYKSIHDLLWEIKKGKVEMRVDPKTAQFTRYARQLLLKIYADIPGKGDCVLMTTGEVLFGEKKACEGKFIRSGLQSDANWRDECTTVIEKELGQLFDADWQSQNLMFESHKNVEERETSWSYPGLWTIYSIEQVVFRMKNPEAQTQMGLPYGNDFCTENFSKQQKTTKIQEWSWIPPDFFRKSHRKSLRSMRVSSKELVGGKRSTRSSFVVTRACCRRSI